MNLVQLNIRPNSYPIILLSNIFLPQLPSKFVSEVKTTLYFLRSPTCIIKIKIKIKSVRLSKKKKNIYIYIYIRKFYFIYLFFIFKIRATVWLKTRGTRKYDLSLSFPLSSYPKAALESQHHITAIRIKKA